MTNEDKRARFQGLADDITRTPHQTPHPVIPKKVQSTTSPVSSTTSTTTTTLKSAKTLIANHNQKNNTALMQCLRDVKIEFSSSITSDFEISDAATLLFLSIRYAKLHPDYLWGRISNLRKCKLRILLILVDDSDCEAVLLRTQTLAVANNVSVILAFSNAEAGRWIELFVVNKTKSISSIEHIPKESDSIIIMDALTEVKAVSKTNVKTLMNEFGTLKDLFEAKMARLSLCHGIGDKKVLALQKAFNQPFFDTRGAVANATTTTTTTSSSSSAAQIITGNVPFVMPSSLRADTQDPVLEELDNDEDDDDDT